MRVTIRNDSVLTEIMNAQGHSMWSFLLSLMPRTALSLHNGGLLHTVLPTTHFWKYQELQEKFPQTRDCQSLHFEMIESFLMVGGCKELGTEIHVSPYF